MGILRVYLSLCVVSGHAGHRVFPWPMHNGVAAVQMFYLISGFYMAMILSSTRYASTSAFYLSRFLRIFLPYWLVLFGVLAWSLATGWGMHRWLTLQPFTEHPLTHNGTAGFLIAAFSNLTLLGQDWVMFLSQEAGRPLAFTSDFARDANPLWHYLVVPQCWSIGLEITFYAFAPCLIRLRNFWLVAIVLVASGARIFAYDRLGLGHDPWIYRFFPFELALFVLGMLAYRFYARSHHVYPVFLRLRSALQYGVGTGALLLLLGLHVFLSGHVPFVDSTTAPFLCNCLLAVGLPFLFFAFGDNTMDRFVGELSYPCYLVHFTIILTMQMLLNFLHLDQHHFLAITSAIFSLLVSTLLVVFFIAPLDKKRHGLTAVDTATRNRDSASIK